MRMYFYQKLAVFLSMTDLFSILKKYLGSSLILVWLGSHKINIGTVTLKFLYTFLQSINKFLESIVTALCLNHRNLRCGYLGTATLIPQDGWHAYSTKNAQESLE